MAIRRLNFTKRVKLEHQHVQVSLGQENAEGVRAFSVELNLPDGLPEEAAVSLEAYHSSPPIRMRFDLGTVGRLSLPAPDAALLTEFPREVEAPNFRLKVIDQGAMRGRLLADAQRIRPVDSSEKKDNRQGLLYIGHQGLGGLIWELECDRAGFEPTLWIDTEADPARELARDPKFIALVYPEVLRGVLTYLIIHEDSKAIDEESEWGHAWYKLAASLPEMRGDPITPEDGNEERVEWISRAVRAFACGFGARAMVCPEEENPA